MKLLETSFPSLEVERVRLSACGCGQVDMPSETVLVMTGVSEEGPWLVELKEILQATINLRS